MRGWNSLIKMRVVQSTAGAKTTGELLIPTMVLAELFVNQIRRWCKLGNQCVERLVGEHIYEKNIPDQVRIFIIRFWII